VIFVESSAHLHRKLDKETGLALISFEPDLISSAEQVSLPAFSRSGRKAQSFEMLIGSPASNPAFIVSCDHLRAGSGET